jgi:hypothetical protein
MKPVALMYEKVLRPFSTSSTETQVIYVLELRRTPMVADVELRTKCKSEGARLMLS